MKSKFFLFLPFLFSTALFLFVCFNFSESDSLAGSIENDRRFFADSGAFVADLESLDEFIAFSSQFEEDPVLYDFLSSNIKSVVKRAAVLKEESGDQYASRLADLAEKISNKAEQIRGSEGEDRQLLLSSLRDNISSLKDVTNLAAKQRLGVLKDAYSEWQEFLSKTIITVSAIFLVFMFVITLLLMKYYGRNRTLLSLFGLGERSTSKDAAAEIEKIKESRKAEFDELGKKYTREQIIGKRKEELLNTIPEGLVAADPAGKVTFLNLAMKKWFGAEMSLIGENISTVFEKAGTSGGEGKFKKNDETFQLSLFKSQNETFYIFRNITNSEELSSKLLNSERLASIGEMAARITHEIRNPLNSIKINSEYLVDNINEIDLGKQQEHLFLIVKEVERLEHITDKYMGMVKYQKEEQRAEIGVSMPTDMLEFLSFHLQELQKRNIELTSGKCDPFALSISLDSFKEIMLNLLKNAWEELEDGGKIAVNIAFKDGNAVISVEDSGSGVPESERESIFRNFYTKKPGGTGIGLSHSRKLAVEAGGKLYVTSSAELGGASFVLELPVRKKH